MPLVDHLQRYVVIVSNQPHPSHFASGMPVDIREALLQDAKHRQFDEIRQLRKVRRHFQINVNSAALRETSQVPRNHRLQSDFVQQRRMQKMGDHANLAH